MSILLQNRPIIFFVTKKHMVNYALRSVTLKIENYCLYKHSAYHSRFAKVVIPVVLLRPP
jgi:hypothetical protein